MTTKFVRKQLLLDPEDLYYVDQIIKNKAEYTSFSQYVRELLKKQIKQKSKDKNESLSNPVGDSTPTKKSRLLAKKGFIKSGGDGFEALNHNEIYK